MRNIMSVAQRIGLCATTAVALCAPAYAQTKQQTELTFDDIVVTATRQSQRLQDVPMAVDVTTGEQITRLSILNVSDIQQLSPGLQITNTTGRNNTATLRGISFDPDSGAFPAVEVYFNEMSVNAQQTFAALYDIAQIEVLRGPQGSTRGKTAPAGAITIATRRPDLNEVNGYVQGTAATRDAYNLQAAVSIPLKSDVLAVRAAVLTDKNRANHVRNIHTGERSRSETKSGRLSVAYEPSPDFRTDVVYQYLDVDSRVFQQVVGTGNQPRLLDPSRSGPAIDVDDRLSVTEGPAHFKNRSHFLTLNASWDLGTHELAFSGGYVDTKLRARRDYDPTNAVPDFINLQDTDTRYDGLTGELRLASRFAGPINYTVSAYRSAISGPTAVSQQSATFFPSTLLGLPGPATPIAASTGLFLPLDITTTVPIKNVTESIAGSLEFQLTDKLRAEVAARYNWLRSNFQTYLTVNTPGLPLFGVPAGTMIGPDLPSNAKTAHRFKALTGGGSIVYEASPDVTTYLSYGHSYRFGPVAVGLTDPLSADLTQTDDETSDSVELGIKSKLLDRRLSLNAALFYQKINNYISRVPQVYYSANRDGAITSSFDFNFNGDVKSKGAEISLSATPTDNWDLDVAASYVDARYDNASAPCNVFDASGKIIIPVGQETARCTRDDRIAEAPRFSLSANTEYRVPVGTNDAFVRALLTYQPGFNSDLAQFKYSSLTNLNIFIGLRSENGWEISGFVKNVFNQERIRSISSSIGQVGTVDPDVVFSSGYRTVSVSAPREFGLTATLNF
ncbi:MAG TPA: TonB-dependent receptor [Pedomonas sp.]|uniref:TonB-dependent receptor n=1 Tax=Pedomonas sp. TaxID=2976421 RepID=UPI002F3E4DD0